MSAVTATSTDARPSSVSLHAGLAAVQIAFASLAVVGKKLVGAVEPSALALLRLSLACVVFVALWLRIRKPVPARDVAGIAGCASLGIFANQILFLHGLRLTTAVHATVLCALIPVFTTLIARALGREVVSPRAWSGVLVAFSGVVVLVGGERFRITDTTVIGDALVIVNSLAYASYLVLVRGYATKHGGLAVVAIGFSAGTLLALPFGAGALAASLPNMHALEWGLVAYVVLVATVFTYLTSAWALRFLDSSIVAVYIYLQPAVASVLAFLFLGERIGGRTIIGAALVLIGMSLVTYRRASPAVSSARS